MTACSVVLSYNIIFSSLVVFSFIVQCKHFYHQLDHVCFCEEELGLINVTLTGCLLSHAFGLLTEHRASAVALQAAFLIVPHIIPSVFISSLIVAHQVFCSHSGNFLYDEILFGLCRQVFIFDFL